MVSVGYEVTVRVEHGHVHARLDADTPLLTAPAHAQRFRGKQDLSGKLWEETNNASAMSVATENRSPPHSMPECTVAGFPRVSDRVDPDITHTPTLCQRQEAEKGRERDLFEQGEEGAFDRLGGEGRGLRLGLDMLAELGSHHALERHRVQLRLRVAQREPLRDNLPTAPTPGTPQSSSANSPGHHPPTRPLSNSASTPVSAPVSR